MWVFLRVFLSTFLGLCWSPHLGPEAKPTESHCCIMNFSITSQRWDCGHTASTICDLASGKDRAAGQYAQLKPVKQFSETIKKQNADIVLYVVLRVFLTGDVAPSGSAPFSRLSKSPRKVLGLHLLLLAGGGVATANAEEVILEPTEKIFPWGWRNGKKYFFHFYKREGKRWPHREQLRKRHIHTMKGIENTAHLKWSMIDISNLQRETHSKHKSLTNFCL